MAINIYINIKNCNLMHTLDAIKSKKISTIILMTGKRVFNPHHQLIEHIWS